MSKIKHTKNELKAQREALSRFERFLPMLQLKKQQLQNEVQRIDSQIAEKETEQEKVRQDLTRWERLFSEQPAPAWAGEDVGPIEKHVVLDRILTQDGNIAGVKIPVLDTIHIRKDMPDLFMTPPWLDDGLDVIEKLITLRVESELLQEQRRLIAYELRVTSQRVNLFEKVKIPECRENIRVIKIFLGDEQTAGVARAKIAKSRSDEEEKQ